MKQYIILIIGIFLILIVKQHSSNFIVNKVQSDNYTIEVHSNVITEDGYILTLHRIPYGRSGIGTNKRQPVYLMHSLFSSADNFVFLDPDKSLAYILADKGYDVWMGNARSVSYCRKHIKLNPDSDKEFWNFTLTEMAKYDLTASIDYILMKTNYKQLQYIGYSQGAALFFMMSSMSPEYQKKVNLFVGLSPAVFLGSMDHPVFSNLQYQIDNILWITNILGIYELHPGRDIFRVVGPRFCPLPGISVICQAFIEAVVGSNPEQFNLNYISSIVANGPEGTGVLQFAHIIQLMKTGKFQKFDYGSEENKIRYGTIEPPQFPLESVTVPAALFYSKNDLLVPEKGVERLSKEIPNVVELYKVKDTKFTHLDFVIANDVWSLVYKRVLDVMDKYRI